MAQSTCAKCGHKIFEVVEQSPLKSNFKLMFVQCAKCGTVVGITEYYNIGARLEKLAQKLKIDLNRL